MSRREVQAILSERNLGSQVDVASGLCNYSLYKPAQNSRTRDSIVNRVLSHSDFEQNPKPPNEQK
jgi:hypothetical protein